MHNQSILRLSFSLVTVGLLGACSKREEAAPPEAAGPRTVHITATDYAFEVPDTLPSGLTSFHLMNNGKEPHHVTIVRLAEGQTLADLPKVGPAGAVPPGMVLIGGPNAATPSGAAEAIVDLRAGRYALLCLIPSPDGKAHMTKGMAKEVTVVQGDTAPQAPSADVTIKLTDYAFDVSGPMTAGHHVFRIENAGPQPHELVLVKLEPGKTVQQMAQWLEKMDGPPPALLIGSGASPMSVGEANFVPVDLTAGEYGLICFVSDSKDGKPHLMHGMMKQVTVM